MYVEPRKMVQMNWFAGQKLRHRCREQMYGHQGGKPQGGGGGGVMNWAIGIDVYTLMCIERHSTKYLTSTLQNCQGHKRKGKTEELLQTGGD